MSEHLAIEEQARQIMMECSRVGFLAFMQGLSGPDRLKLADALFGSGLVISDEWQAISRDSELLTLRRTIGCAQWLDNLDDEQWRVLADEIMPVFRRADLSRGKVHDTCGDRRMVL